VVEGVDVSQPLVEELLRLRVFSRHGVVQRPHPFDERRLAAAARHVLIVLCLRRAARQKQREEECGELHLSTLLSSYLKANVGLYAIASWLGFNFRRAVDCAAL
jgi:hypothetical protein